MEEARAVLARLERIEALEREGAGVRSLLAELRELVREAAEWAERERDPLARKAAAALAEAQLRGLHHAHERPVPSAAPAGSIE
jgi:ElaB/YqjD/DUF883 family membrane-anchored ribosome-binding protein